MKDQEIIWELENLIDQDIISTTKSSDVRYGSSEHSYYRLSKNLKVKELSIKNVYLFDWQLTDFVELLYQLKELDYLSLRNCDINSMAPLSGLNHLKELNLSYNEIKTLNGLEKLTNLRELELRGNQLADIRLVNQLPKLKILDLSDNVIYEIPDLSGLVRLEELSLEGNNLVELKPLNVLIENKLNYLRVRDNNITRLDEIKYEKLAFYDFSYNQITELPYSYVMQFFENKLSIEQIKFFKNIVIRAQRYELAAELRDLELQLQKGKKAIYGEQVEQIQIQVLEVLYTLNPILSPPLEVIKNGKEAIERYFDKAAYEGLDYIHEAKLTFVGDGSAGKTSLQKRLIDPKSDLPDGSERTRGIEIHDWEIKRIEEGEEKVYTAHIWDFGGQDVYYPVHRFFITENSVFVLLASTRNNKHNFDYWIPTIHQFGGKSPIILGQTCHEGNKMAWNDIGMYFSDSNFNLIKTGELPYVELNLLKKNEGLATISKVIEDQILDLPNFGKPVPKSWGEARKSVAKAAENKACISFDAFTLLCEETNAESFSKTEDVQDFCEFLHDIGVVLWYSKKESLKDWVFLRPEWVMNAVYQIIDDDRVQENRGVIEEADFRRIWKGSEYETRAFLLKQMLEIFKIAFPMKHKAGNYLMPSRMLSIDEQTEKWEKTAHTKDLIVKYDFMPRGLVNQLSAELSRYIYNDEGVWNNAVNLVYENRMAECQVFEDFYKRQIEIRAKGSDARSLSAIVLNALKDITGGYKGVEDKINVPCSCEECSVIEEPTYFKHRKLMDWYLKNPERTVTCNESGEQFKIADILYNSGLSKTKPEEKNQPKKMFISYSKFDVDYLQEFQDHLVTLKQEGLVTFDCREIEFGKEWDEEIKCQLRDSDVMVCLISVKFLNTDYITTVEIKNAIEQNKTIVPIVIKACDWEGSELGKFQTAQRGKIVSLNNDLRLNGQIKAVTPEERAAFWTAIIKELREKLF